MAIKVLVCDGCTLIRYGVHYILGAQPDVEVVETTDSGLHAMVLVRNYRPDVLVTGLASRGISGLELIRRLTAEELSPFLRVVVMITPTHTDDVVKNLLRVGVKGLVTQGSSQEEIVATVRAAAQGRTMLCTEVTQLLVDWFNTQPMHRPEPLRPTISDLTPRERQILLLVAQGRSTEDVASELYIGVSTVRTHLHRVRRKLELRDRAQIVSFAYRAGLISS